MGSLDPVLAALIATTFTWLLTAAGASLVFFFKEMKRVWLDGMLGFTGGVMIAASFWSLLAPSIAMAENQGQIPWLPAAVGFASGALFLFALDRFMPHLHINFKENEAEGVKKVTGISDSDINIVESGDHLTIGLNDIEFLHTPGHTPGSQCFKINENLISGDTLFIQGCGRVDLPGSNSDDMYHSLKKLGDLPDETILYPGHHYSPEEFQSMGKTKENNMYLKISDIETWRQIMG